jgi:hypothetical protein
MSAAVLLLLLFVAVTGTFLGNRGVVHKKGAEAIVSGPIVAVGD